MHRLTRIRALSGVGLFTGALKPSVSLQFLFRRQSPSTRLAATMSAGQPLQDPHTGSDPVITMTLGECAENHVGMEQLGERASSGLQNEHLWNIQEIIEKSFPQVTTELIRLDRREGQGDEAMGLGTAESPISVDEEVPVAPRVPRADVLVIRNFINLIAPRVAEEQFSLDPDKQYFDRRRGKVLNKHARYNLCFEPGDGRAANFDARQGTVVGFNRVPHTHAVQKYIARLLAAAGVPEHVVSEPTLRVETNVYMDPQKNGIGFHGDTERRVVVGVRLGLSPEARMPIVFRWYNGGKAMGEFEDRVIDLGPGDVYFMSEKAAGSDWMRKKIPTLRHAAGAPKYTQTGR
uniref:Alpha-ketoglutarate-dependent dioxygenase AlkB-like domain-containing protein n=1 Tax=Chromera velia CCMP2878 TaxID=1169474 RepID=A0A0G4ICV2_9ALVE|eukprot:Cvel_13264.t1-p1 / transcript=Cvel_13264.t1 / gene=Cvel_13264 / organism=Chromera_velia_CCMP2878 / gene_product=Uncharacterized protein R156, putative / transcript_product=Uncharacterized protein R156, putative / location=Cvel_scaffold899:45031-46071(-) / protein_length=347 / sequence_SO=supercontig / SO=protein_coding / is_pseudo=false